VQRDLLVDWYTWQVYDRCWCREAMLAEMGIALREDCSVMGVFTPRKVNSTTLIITVHVYTTTSQWLVFNTTITRTLGHAPLHIRFPSEPGPTVPVGFLFPLVLEESLWRRAIINIRYLAPMCNTAHSCHIVHSWKTLYCRGTSVYFCLQKQSVNKLLQ